MLKSVEGLVVKIAARYRHGPFAMEDLVSEGTVGALEGIERFDPEKGDLSSICASRIRCRIDEYLHTAGSTVYRPKSRKEKKMRWHLSSKKAGYEAEGFSENRALELAARDIGVSVDHAAAALAIRTSLQFDSDDDEEWRQFACDSPPVEKQLDGDRVTRALEQAMSGLDDRERYVLNSRLTGDPKSLDDLADEFGVTRNRVRQIQSGAMDHVRVELEQMGIQLGDLV
ncbi:sigma-70 family RNA polymerase sigma factor [Roseovarius indicus]|uniref:sigma-70 family RNA polymerase sigma factor n=1 Tax=Roseovarius indicus TaxID=540747 RepID=UPI0032EF3E87